MCELCLCWDYDVFFLREHGQYDAVVVCDHLLEGLVDSFNRQLVGEHVHGVVFKLDAGHGCAVDEMARDFTRIFLVFNFVAVVVGFFEAREVFAACAVIFRCGESATHCAEEFAVNAFERRYHVVAFGHTADREGVFG